MCISFKYLWKIDFSWKVKHVVEKNSVGHKTLNVAKDNPYFCKLFVYCGSEEPFKLMYESN